MTETCPAPNPAPEGRHSKCRHGRRGGRIFLAALLATGVGFFAGNALSHGFHHLGGHFGHHTGFTRVFAQATP